MPTGRNVYEDPDLWRWAGGMEGLPETAGPDVGGEAPADWSPLRRSAHERLALAGALAPGLGLAMLLALLGSGLASGLAGLAGLERAPVSPILLAVVLGLLIRNAIGVPTVYDPGLRLCLQRVLRIGVALLGIRLSLGAVGTLGLAVAPLLLVTISAGLGLTLLIGRLVGVPRRLTTLIAVGTAICGNSAILATGPAIGAKEEEVSYAVGTITLFGVIGLVSYPFLANSLFGGDHGLAGVFLGAAIHDTAQVTGAGVIYLQQFGAPEALDGATVTKLLRNLSMVAVIPFMAWLDRRQAGEDAGGKPPRFQAVPFFVIGFMAMALLRSIGDVAAPGLGADSAWAALVAATTKASTWCLITAMGAAGLGTDLTRLRAVGLRPLGVGLFAATAVGVIAGVGIRLFGNALG